MTVPTRIISRAQFEELIKAESPDDGIPLFFLTNIPFEPPLPEGTRRAKVKRVSMNILLMNVSEPVIYKDNELGKAFIILNGYNQDEIFTYENFQDVHIVKGSWSYRLAPSYWAESDETDDLDDVIFVFDHNQGQDDDEGRAVYGDYDYTKL